MKRVRQSTTALHIAIALLEAGQCVATIDLDSRQKASRITSPRLGGARRAQIGAANSLLHRSRRESFGRIQRGAAVRRLLARDRERNHDGVVIDTPGHDSYLMQLAHSMADTLVTPLHDSFVAFDVLATIDPTNFTVTGESH
jgi:chromosome partitioning protein